MNVEIATNAEAWARQIAAYMVHFRLEKDTALRIQGRLLTERLIRMTPPKSRAQGRRRVRIDIGRLFFGQNEKGKAQALEPGREGTEGPDNVRLWVAKDGRVFGVERQLYRPDATLEEIAKHHQKYRDKRGRVSTAGTRDREVGRWRFLDRLVVDGDRVKEYADQRQELTGQAKGGWARAVATLGGRVSSWIGEHAYAGRLQDRLAEPDGFLQMDNASEWAVGGFSGEGESGRVAAAALASRSRDIGKSIAVAEAKAQAKAFKRGAAIARALS